jgi:hypothetical protein
VIDTIARRRPAGRQRYNFKSKVKDAGWQPALRVGGARSYLRTF